ncbi:MAG: tRNA epoxyqueuosine(34) reductase QueG [Bacteroidota bacterium]
MDSINNIDSTQRRSETIREEALRLGFADCGFSRAGALPGDAERLRSWLAEGRHAGMGYMNNHFEKRTDPTLLVSGANSVISLLYNYYTDRRQNDPRAPVLSTYAYGKDYHLVMKEKMKQLFDFIREQFGEVRGRIFVDSAPVLDRAWAGKAGLGWIGKNSCLISKKAGSFVFIGEIILDLELEYNPLPQPDLCGNCRRCVDACPTSAILPGRTVDARLCISYHTIENRGPLPDHLQGNFANRVFGCDICQDVCPWNSRAEKHREPAFEPVPGLLEMSRQEWYEMDREQYNRFFKESAVSRTGYKGLKRNLEFIEKDPPAGNEAYDSG